MICFKCLNDDIRVMPHSNRLFASATAVHLVYPLTGNDLSRWECDAGDFSCVTCASSFRLHGGLVGAGSVPLWVPHGSASLQRRDSSAGLPEYSQQRLVSFHLFGQKQVRGGGVYVCDAVYRYCITHHKHRCMLILVSPHCQIQNRHSLARGWRRPVSECKKWNWDPLNDGCQEASWTKK